MLSSAQKHHLIEAVHFHLQLGNVAAAEGMLRKALRQSPRDAELLHEIGILFFNLGRHVEARNLLSKAAAFDPRNPDRHANHAAAAAAAGDADAAVEAALRALTLAPKHVAALTSLARVQAARGQTGKARDLYLSLLEGGTAGEAVDQEAIGFVAALAEKSIAAGDIDAGDICARWLAVIAPHAAEAWNMLGINEGARSSFPRAAQLCGRAARLAPYWLPARLNRAGMAGMAGEVQDSLEELGIAQIVAPGEWVIYANRAAILDKTGDIPAALTSARRAIALNPASVTGWMTLIALGLRTESARPDEDAKTFGAIAAGLAGPPRRQARSRPSTRLRIGYYSADFRAHSCAWFIEPLLAHHDPLAVETTAYAEVPAPDEVTARLRTLVDHWRPTVGLSDAALAQRIAADSIDILVDLTGLFAGGRPLLFARRPAPVQVSWLGYNATTGLNAIDWKLVDERMAPPGVSLDWFAERLWHLPRPAHCWRPPAGSPAPEMAIGRPTFGSFNNLAKLSAETILLWAGVLAAVPDARLVLKSEHTGNSLVQRRIRSSFEAAGIAGGRIEFLDYATSTADHLSKYRLIDVGLDPLPYNGTTTTCEAFWMGVPVVTLGGSRLVSRIGASLAGALGHDDFVAATPAAYIETARGLIQDRSRLRYLRQSLRKTMIASPLCDEIGFTRSIEDAYREMISKV